MTKPFPEAGDRIRGREGFARPGFVGTVVSAKCEGHPDVMAVLIRWDEPMPRLRSGSSPPNPDQWFFSHGWPECDFELIGPINEWEGELELL